MARFLLKSLVSDSPNFTLSQWTSILLLTVLNSILFCVHSLTLLLVSPNCSLLCQNFLLLRKTKKSFVVATVLWWCNGCLVLPHVHYIPFTSSSQTLVCCVRVCTEILLDACVGVVYFENDMAIAILESELLLLTVECSPKILVTTPLSQMLYNPGSTTHSLVGFKNIQEMEVWLRLRFPDSSPMLGVGLIRWWQLPNSPPCS